MTYNFDPDKWLENHRALLEERHRRCELDDGAYAEALADLQRRHEEMVKRLDGTYQISK